MYRLTPAAYIFTHAYMKTMQQGIQTAHTVAEFFINPTQHQPEQVVEWATDNKTLIVLDAGAGVVFGDNYNKIISIVEQYQLPYAFFSEPDNNGQRTFGFIMAPATITKINEELATMIEYNRDPDEHPVLATLKPFRRAS